jgi:cytochrome c556
MRGLAQRRGATITRGHLDGSGLAFELRTLHRPLITLEQAQRSSNVRLISRSNPQPGRIHAMQKNSLIAIALGTVTALVALPAAAQFQKPEDAVKYRKAAFTVMATHFGRLGAMANGRIPFDAKVAAENADLALTMSKLPYAAFTEGSDKGDTKAKAEIWTEGDKFRAAATKMQDEMVKLNAAAKTGSVDNLKAAFGPTGAACKACHDAYRKE